MKVNTELRHTPGATHVPSTSGVSVIKIGQQGRQLAIGKKRATNQINGYGRLKSLRETAVEDGGQWRLPGSWIFSALAS